MKTNFLRFPKFSKSNIQNWLRGATIGCLVILTSACSSTGHEARTQPVLVSPFLGGQKQVVLTSERGELQVGIKEYLESKGIKVISTLDPKAISPTSRYAISVNSADLDICLPEGSRQMHFDIGVTDLVEKKKVYILDGDFGCKNTIVRKFGEWFSN